MSRAKTITDEELIRLLEEYRLDNPNTKIKIPRFGEYIRNKGYNVQDHTIRRSTMFRECLDQANQSTEEMIYSDLVTFKTLDVDAFLQKHRKLDSMKEALIARDVYYARMAANAAEAIGARKSAEEKVQKLEERIVDLEAQLEAVQARADNIDIRKKNKVITRLKQILDGYIYPDAANAILEKEGLLEVVNSVIPQEQMDKLTIHADTEIEPSKYDSVNTLMGGFDD